MRTSDGRKYPRDLKHHCDPDRVVHGEKTSDTSKQWYVVVSPGSFPSQWYRYAVPSTPLCLVLRNPVKALRNAIRLRLAKNVIFIDLYFHWTVVSYMECTQRVTLVPFTDSNEYFFFLRRSSSSSSYFLSFCCCPLSLVFLVGRAWQQKLRSKKIYYI